MALRAATRNGSMANCPRSKLAETGCSRYRARVYTIDGRTLKVRLAPLHHNGVFCYEVPQKRRQPKLGGTTGAKASPSHVWDGLFYLDLGRWTIVQQERSSYESAVPNR